MTDLIRFALLGLGTGGIYALLGLGLVVIYRGSGVINFCLLYTSPSPRDGLLSRMPSSA